MTTVGIVGGLGPESTIDYYRRILEAYEHLHPGRSPSIVIDSLDVQRALDLVARDRQALVEYLLGSLRRLAGAWRRQPEWLIAASYDGHTGVPAVFPSWCFGDFASLRGDAGARSILARHADRCLRIPMPNAAVDIDRPEDLLALGTEEAQP